MVNVLVSEPHEEIRELIRHVIAGMNWAAVDDPQDSDLLLLEPGWPVGLDLARRLRAERPDLPIVCVSIYPRREDADGIAPNAYLVKPFSVTELQRALREALSAAGEATGVASEPLSHQMQ
jgi:CheY-like chemotaxis protein